MFSNKAIAIRDATIQSFVHEIGLNLNSLLAPEYFVNYHREWLLNSNFYVQNLDRFKHGYITAGCTEAFNEVYTENCYVLHGEYTYHVDTGRAVESQIENIPYGSRLIISYPFAATGNPHKDWNSILDICEQKNIKIFIDACLAGVSIGKLDLKHPNITHVAFSFSKAFYTGFFRCGVVYTNETKSPASVTNRHLYINHPSVGLHLQLMKKFTSDYIVERYRMKQVDVCKEHQLVQSDCVIFGLENGVRQCLSPVLGNRSLFPIHP